MLLGKVTPYDFFSIRYTIWHPAWCYSATHSRRTLQHTATHCNTLQHTAAHCSTLQHTAAHCNTLQHPHNGSSTCDMTTLYMFLPIVNISDMHPLHSCDTTSLHTCDMMPHQWLQCRPLATAAIRVTWLPDMCVAPWLWRASPNARDLIPRQALLCNTLAGATHFQRQPCSWHDYPMCVCKVTPSYIVISIPYVCVMWLPHTWVPWIPYIGVTWLPYKYVTWHPRRCYCATHSRLQPSATSRGASFQTAFHTKNTFCAATSRTTPPTANVCPRASRLSLKCDILYAIANFVWSIWQCVAAFRSVLQYVEPPFCYPSLHESLYPLNQPLHPSNEPCALTSLRQGYVSAVCLKWALCPMNKIKWASFSLEWVLAPYSLEAGKCERGMP